MKVRSEVLKIDHSNLTEHDYRQACYQVDLVGMGKFYFWVTLAIMSIMAVVFTSILISFFNVGVLFVMLLLLALVVVLYIRKRKEIKRAQETLTPKTRVIPAIYPLLERFNSDVAIEFEVSDNHPALFELLKLRQQSLQVRREFLVDLYRMYESGEHEKTIFEQVRLYRDVVEFACLPI